MQIRKATVKDAKEMCSTVRATISKVNSKDYTPRQIKAWLTHNTAKGYRESMLKGRKWFVAVEGKKIVGVTRIDSEKETIKALYVLPKMRGKGIGKKMYKKMEHLLKNFGVKRLRVESTLTAESFYKKMGLKRVKRSSVEMNGVKIPIIVMVKKLN